jgi:hypothetical protein
LYIWAGDERSKAMGAVIFVIFVLLVNARAQYFDPVLFQQNGKGEISGRIS